MRRSQFNIPDQHLASKTPVKHAHVSAVAASSAPSRISCVRHPCRPGGHGTKCTNSTLCRCPDTVATSCRTGLPPGPSCQRAPKFVQIASRWSEGHCSAWPAQKVSSEDKISPHGKYQLETRQILLRFIQSRTASRSGDPLPMPQQENILHTFVT
mgnify:CR=1 FL=1